MSTGFRHHDLCLRLLYKSNTFTAALKDKRGTMSNAKRSLARKRINEAKLESTKQYVEGNNRMMMISQWENKSGTKAS